MVCAFKSATCHTLGRYFNLIVKYSDVLLVAGGISEPSWSNILSIDLAASFMAFYLLVRRCFNSCQTGSLSNAHVVRWALVMVKELKSIVFSLYLSNSDWME